MYKQVNGLIRQLVEVGLCVQLDLQSMEWILLNHRYLFDILIIFCLQIVQVSSVTQACVYGLRQSSVMDTWTVTTSLMRLTVVCTFLLTCTSREFVC